MRSYISVFLFLLFSSLASATAFNQRDPLPPEEVFKLSAYAISANTIKAEWDVLDEYFLYKDKFKFISDTPGIELGEPRFPASETKEDEFFGNVEVFRHKVPIEIPIIRTNDSIHELQLKTISQGCADAGLCYPPFTQHKTLALLTAESGLNPVNQATTQTSSLSFLETIGKKIGITGEQAFLPPHKAFVFSIDVIDGNHIKAHWDIADDYYLYKDKFEFDIINGEGASLGTAVYPPGKKKHDEFFGEMEVYFNQASILIPLNRSINGTLDLELKVGFQGCADAGFCYPPQSETSSFVLPSGVLGLPPNTLTVSSSVIESSALSEQDSIANSIKSSNLFGIILSFFGLGLLLSFTPCVLPMIPILSGIIVGQGKKVTTRKAFTMSLVYVLAMAFTYTIAGILAGLFGANLQATFQNPWILTTFSLVFVLLALSMFGFYELQIPSAWQSKLSEISNKQKSGSLAGVAVMGFLSALIVGPCVAAPLMGALIYIGQTGDAVLGGVALFSLSMGMGAPLIIIGTSAGKLLPKAGPWMDAIKAVFGVMLLAVAIWMLERILPPAVAMLLWAILLIVSGVFMGALQATQASTAGWSKLWKGLGIVILLYGILQLIGVAMNSKDALQPLRGISALVSGNSTAANKLAFKKIKSLDDLNHELALAQQQNKPVFLDFYADWCVSCKEMEKYTFSQSDVQAVLSKGILLKADVTANDAIDQQLMQNFGIFGPPSMLFFDRQGNEQREKRLVGFLAAEKFHAHASQAFE